MRCPSKHRPAGAAGALLIVALALTGCGPKSETKAMSPDDPLGAIVTAARAERPESANTRVILLGFDGADMDIIMPMVEKGELPAFKRLLDEGAHGRLLASPPLLSPIIWTTIATGKPMDEHGIHDFVVEDSEKGEGIKPITSDQRLVEALWDVIGRFGLPVGLVGWMVSSPAEEVNGWWVSDDVGLLAYEYGKREDDPREDATWPPSLMKDIAPMMRGVGDITYEEVHKFVNVSEEEFRSSYARSHRKGNLVNNLRLNLSTAETFRKIGRWLYEEKAPRFLAWYFEFVDANCHLFMPYAPPRMEGIGEREFEKYGNAVAEVYRYSDRVLGEVMDAMDENTVLLLVSDHGFRSGKTRLKEGSDFHDRAAAMWHRPFGVFFAYGKGVKRGERVHGATIFDIAPTVLGLLGMPKAEDMQGKFLADAFTVTPPTKTVETYERGRREKTLGIGEYSEDDLVLKKLEALNYISAADGSRTASGHMNLGIYYMSTNRPEEALAEFQAALKKQPSAGAHSAIGDAYGRMGKYAEAAAAYARAAEMDPKRQHLSRLNAVKMLLGAGKPNEALAEAQTAVAEDPNDSTARLVLGRCLLATRQPERCEAEFEKAVELEPQDPEAHRQLAILRLKLGRFDEAIQDLRASMEIDPSRRDNWTNLGTALMNKALKLRDPQQREEAMDRALEHLDATIEKFPNYAVAFFNRAELRRFRGQGEAAIEDLEKAIELDPDYEKAKQRLGALRARMQK